MPSLTDAEITDAQLLSDNVMHSEPNVDLQHNKVDQQGLQQLPASEARQQHAHTAAQRQPAAGGQQKPANHDVFHTSQQQQKSSSGPTPPGGPPVSPSSSGGTLLPSSNLGPVEDTYQVHQPPCGKMGLTKALLSMMQSVSRYQTTTSTTTGGHVWQTANFVCQQVYRLCQLTHIPGVCATLLHHEL